MVSGPTATTSCHASSIDINSEYRGAIARSDAFQAQPDAALMIMPRLHAGMIELEQAVMVWHVLYDWYISSILMTLQLCSDCRYSAW
jgi:hypothetical protein